jgi:hypothetical protein
MGLKPFNWASTPIRVSAWLTLAQSSIRAPVITSIACCRRSSSRAVCQSPASIHAPRPTAAGATIATASPAASHVRRDLMADRTGSRRPTRS